MKRSQSTQARQLISMLHDLQRSTVEKNKAFQPDEYEAYEEATRIVRECHQSIDDFSERISHEQKKDCATT